VFIFNSFSIELFCRIFSVAGLDAEQRGSNGGVLVGVAADISGDRTSTVAVVAATYGGCGSVAGRVAGGATGFKSVAASVSDGAAGGFTGAAVGLSPKKDFICFVTPRRITSYGRIQD
jgi:hypothetical protein